MGLAWGSVTVTAGLSEIRFSSEPLDQVLDVWDLLELPDHEGSEIPCGVVLDGSPRAVRVEVFPEDGLDRG